VPILLSIAEANVDCLISCTPNATLFQDCERPLQDFMVDRDIITVNEWLRGDVYQTPRSGFLLLRNTPRSNEFLDVWAKSYDFYTNIENPEQVRCELACPTSRLDNRSRHCIVVLRCI